MRYNEIVILKENKMYNDMLNKFKNIKQDVKDILMKVRLEMKDSEDKVVLENCREFLFKFSNFFYQTNKHEMELDPVKFLNEIKEVTYVGEAKRGKNGELLVGADGQPIIIKNDRPDRIIFMLEVYRNTFISQLLELKQELINFKGKINENVDVSLEKTIQDINKISKGFKKDWVVESFKDFYNSIKHFKGIWEIYPTMNNVRWDTFSRPDELLRKLGEVEELFKSQKDELQTRIPLTMQHIDNDKIIKIMEFPEDDVFWLMLNYRECRIEAKAGGHCGNSSGSAGDRILSLRKLLEDPVSKDKFWKVLATFTLNAENKLVERKARFNNKPSQELKKYIIPLFKNKDIVKGIAGEKSYKRENDFKLSDLTPEEIQDVGKANPYLKDVDVNM